MTVTTSSLTRAAGAAAAGAIFIGIQIGHQQVNLASIVTTPSSSS